MAGANGSGVAQRDMLAVRVSINLHDRLKQLAKRERRTKARQTEIALEEHLERHDAPGAEGKA